MVRVNPHVTRAYPGIVAMLRAMMTFWMPPPRTEATSRASMIIGKHMRASMARMMTALAKEPE